MREIGVPADPGRRSGPMSLPRAVAEAVVVAIACGAVALGFNAARARGIPLVQRAPYQILVPCPETGGHADALGPEAARAGLPQALVLDARAKDEFERWHLPHALSLPYDYLEPVSPQALQRVAASGAQSVVVYGDGEDPDSGEQLARELAGKGIRNVGFVAGGAAKLGGPGEGALP